MEEIDKSAISWLHGLQEFFKFQNDEISSNYVDFILKLLYANNPAIAITEEADIVEFIGTLRKFADNNIFNAFHKYYREEHNPKHLQDAFSRGQVQSKIWLVTELAKIKNSFSNTLILAGWYGQLLRYFNNIQFDSVRIVELDKIACLISDDIVNLDLIQDYKVKAVHADINTLTLTKKGYEFQIENFKNPEQKKFNERFSPDLIINTSAEHMDEKWYEAIRFKEFENKPIVVIQSNNLFDVEEHINCVHSIDHMKKNYPMSEIFYEGELQLKGYKRIMLIGLP
jgi:hypothetical protein